MVSEDRTGSARTGDTPDVPDPVVARRGIELRILSGLHAGARLPLHRTLQIAGPEPAPRSAVGNDSDADSDADSTEKTSDDGSPEDHAQAVLQDDTFSRRQIRLTLEQQAPEPLPGKPAPTQTVPDTGWYWQEGGQDDGRNGVQARSPRLPLDEIVPFDDVALTVSHSASAWPDAASIAASLPRQAASGVEHPDVAEDDGSNKPAPGVVGVAPVPAQTALLQADSEVPNSADAPEVKSRDTTSSPSVTDILGDPAQNFGKGRFRRYATLRWMSIAAVVVIGVLLLLTVLNRSRGTPPARPGVAAKPENQSPARVTKVLERLGLTSRLHLEIDKTGHVRVVGWVADDTQRDTLASALSQLSPMPGMRVFVESEVLKTAQALVSAYGPYIDVRYEGDGKLNVMGVIDSDSVRTQLRQTFADQLPGAMLIDTHLLERDAMALVLHDTLEDAGIKPVNVAWSSSGLEVSAPADVDRQRFQAAITAFKAAYGEHLPVIPTIGAAHFPLTTTMLPFQIESVTGGPLPSVVVERGVRLLPGGQYRGFTLVSVSDEQIVFEGLEKRITLAR